MNFRKNAAGVPNSQSQVQLFPILLINFIGTLGFSIVLPFLVFLVKDFGGNAIVLVLCLQYILNFIGAPILGKWSDTYGRKKILLLSNAGTLIGWIFFLVALFLPFFIVSFSWRRYLPNQCSCNIRSFYPVFSTAKD